MKHAHEKCWSYRLVTKSIVNFLFDSIKKINKIKCIFNLAKKYTESWHAHVHKSSRSESEVPTSFHCLWPKPLLCSKGCEGSTDYLKGTCDLLLSNFFVQNMAEFGGFPFCKPKSVCHGFDSATGC